MDFIPDESAINTEAIEVDKDTMDMLRGMNMAGLPGITVQQVGWEEGGRRDGTRELKWQMGLMCLLPVCLLLATEGVGVKHRASAELGA